MSTLDQTNTISLKQLREQFPKYIEAINMVKVSPL